MSDPAYDTRAARLREEFDRSFALPPPTPPEGLRDFVLVQVNEPPAEARIVALAAENLRGIERVASVVAVPSHVDALVGIAGWQGTIVPVFRLPGASRHSSQRWRQAPLLALTETGDPDQPLAAFAFERLEGFVRVAPQQVHTDSTQRDAEGQRRELLAWQNALLPVLYTSELLRALITAQPTPEPGTIRHGGL